MDALASACGSNHRSVFSPALSGELESPANTNIENADARMSEKEDTTSVSWIFLGMRKIEEKTFFVSREHGYLRICEGERETMLPLVYVYQDMAHNRFFVSNDDHFLVRCDDRQMDTLYVNFHNPMTYYGMTCRKPLESPLHCAVYKENQMDRYRIRWPQEAGERAKEIDYRTLGLDKRG